MARAVDDAWPDVELCGLVATRYGHAGSDNGHEPRIRVIEAGHPVPDHNSIVAAQGMLELVRGLGSDDLVLALVSGGGSASLALPVPQLSLADKQALTRSLLQSGAPIGAINTVRRHVSAIKGGRLAAAARPAKVVTLLISDVPGDDPAAIASGPTLADGTTPRDALVIIDHYRIPISPSLRQWLGSAPLVPCPEDNGPHALIATPGQALQAAASNARRSGVHPVILGDAIEGESAAVARDIAADALARKARGEGPLVLLSGGETTVTIGSEGAGRGGRNCEFLLALAIALGGAEGIYAVAADTDGIDGTEDAAGAFCGPGTLRSACAAGMDPAAQLARHDSYTLFDRIGDLLITGPTQTNVNDFRAVLILP